MPTRREPRDRPLRGPPAEELAERRLRALEEPLTVRARPGFSFPALEVRNPIHRTSYLALFPRAPSDDGALCTCTDFARRGLGSCKHLAAAYAWLRQHPEAPPAPADPTGELWAEIDLRLRLGRTADVDDPREMARPGGVLFEQSPGGAEPAPPRGPERRNPPP